MAGDPFSPGSIAVQRHVRGFDPPEMVDEPKERFVADQEEVNFVDIVVVFVLGGWFGRVLTR